MQIYTDFEKTELEQLQNQINPHFLFNMLNNILVLVQESPEEATNVLKKMNNLLIYQFNTGNNKHALLSEDIQFINDLLNLEKIRRDQFEFDIIVENNAEKYNVPPMLFINFVENAVKYSKDAENLSYIRIYFGATENTLHFTCLNSKPEIPTPKNEFGGLGLVNIRRRLELLYADNHTLNIHDDEKTFKVQLEVKI